MHFHSSCVQIIPIIFFLLLEQFYFIFFVLPTSKCWQVFKTCQILIHIKRVNFVCKSSVNLPVKTWNKIHYNRRWRIKTSHRPLIISASRSTDIPAFHSEWLINRLRRVYVSWINPFNRAKSPIYFRLKRLVYLSFGQRIPKPNDATPLLLWSAWIELLFPVYAETTTKKKGSKPNVPPLEPRIWNLLSRLSE